MAESVVRFPVKCPMCGQESLIGSSLDTILQTLATDRPIKLYANCAHHRVVWVASDIERGQIREYAAAVYFSVVDQSRGPRRCALQ
jgi:hypothetical protein